MVRYWKHVADFGDFIRRRVFVDESKEVWKRCECSCSWKLTNEKIISNQNVFKLLNIWLRRKEMVSIRYQVVKTAMIVLAILAFIVPESFFPKPWSLWHEKICTPWMNIVKKRPRRKIETEHRTKSCVCSLLSPHRHRQRKKKTIAMSRDTDNN